MIKLEGLLSFNTFDHSLYAQLRSTTLAVSLILNHVCLQYRRIFGIKLNNLIIFSDFNTLLLGKHLDADLTGLLSKFLFYECIKMFLSKISHNTAHQLEEKRLP